MVSDHGAKTLASKRIDNEVIGISTLSSIGLKSKCSINEAAAPAKIPANPIIAPIIIENDAIARLPHQDLFLFL